MSDGKKTVKFFLGSNTPIGFVSRYEQITNTAVNDRLFVIKGGPGTGKSTLMKKVASAISKEGTETEYIYCSSDVDSLDGVIFHNIKATIADGTPPHVIEPRYPGAFEQIVPVFECWDDKKLAENKDAIIEMVNRNSKMHEQCCRFLAAAGALIADTYRIALEFTDLTKVERVAERIAAKEFKRMSKGCGKESVRFISAITNKGVLLYSETAKALAEHIYLIEDDYGVSSKHILAHLRKRALDAGYNVITCYCPMSPYDRIDHLFIPELSLGFMTANWFVIPELVPEKVINSRRFTDAEAIKARKKRLSFNRKAIRQMLGHAVSILADAKSSHDQIEKIYINCMDFDKITALTEEVIRQMNDLS